LPRYISGKHKRFRSMNSTGSSESITNGRGITSIPDGARTEFIEPGTGDGMPSPMSPSPYF
jgi:hypothetical protein